MLNANMMGGKTTVAAALTATSTSVQLPAGKAGQLNPGAGNHTYLTIRNSVGGVERIKVGAALGDTMPILVRGVDGTIPQSFPAGTCAAVEPTPTMVCELVTACNGAQALAPVTVTPGTVCMASCDCIEVDSAGRITKITKGTSC